MLSFHRREIVQKYGFQIRVCILSKIKFHVINLKVSNFFVQRKQETEFAEVDWFPINFFTKFNLTHSLSGNSLNKLHYKKYLINTNLSFLEVSFIEITKHHVFI